jgi:hypothetical protein
MFEHTVTYVPVGYHKGESEGIILKQPGLPLYPDPASLWEHPDFERHFRQMGREGWELASVQPLLMGQYRAKGSVNTSYGFGLSLTAGYTYFWKRPA